MTATAARLSHMFGATGVRKPPTVYEKIVALGVTYDRIATDDWESFIKTFSVDAHDIGKQHTVGILQTP